MMRRWFAALAAVGMALAGVAAGTAAALAASAPPCTAMNASSRASYTGLQTAVNAAAAGDEVVVGGTCTGTVSVTKNLTITGRANSPTLDGGHGRSVLRIAANVSVTLDKLVITNGSSSLAPNGAGITNMGTVTLQDSTVTGNTGVDGGGIFNDFSGTVILNGSTTVTGNIAANGGGIVNFGTVTMNGGSKVTGNTATSLGGGIDNLGAVTMNGGSNVTGNTAQQGGGIYNRGTLVGAVAEHNVSDNIFPPK